MKLEIGKTYHVRTEGDHWIGRLVEIDGPSTVTLDRASWVADTGLLGEFLASGLSDRTETEPVARPIMLHWRAITEWPFSLPTAPTPTPMHPE